MKKMNMMALAMAAAGMLACAPVWAEEAVEAGT